MAEKYELSDTPISEWTHGANHSDAINSLTVATLLSMDNDDDFPPSVSRALDTVYYYLLENKNLRKKFKKGKI